MMMEDSQVMAEVRRRGKKEEVYDEVLRRLKESQTEEAKETNFDLDLLSHFTRLPTKYALDVNVEKAEDVLMHMRLLHLARNPSNRPVFDIHLVQVPPSSDANTPNYACSSCVRDGSTRSIHPPPAFGSSPNLEALALEASISQVQDENTVSSRVPYSRAMHEITFAADDKPKLLSRKLNPLLEGEVLWRCMTSCNDVMLAALLAEVGLNIQEAHVFSTVDGYSLDFFVVDGWPFEETEQLQAALEKEVFKIQLWSSSSFVKHFQSNHCVSSPVDEPQETITKSESDYLTIPDDGTDVWEIDPQLLKYEKKIASGSYGDLYKGSYCSQEVAIKVLKSERLDSDVQKEFAQEVYIMRKVRHKNVVQFIGSCTKLPSLCIVTEFMSGGSVYDFLHKQKGSFKLPALLRVAIDISMGMNYLHQNNIIHRDLKAPNLLMDENDVVKVADFGVARVKTQTGVMTAETGTYRWMAPEVIEHKPYDQKADVFSFGIVLWELLTGKLPYDYLTPIQAAVGVVQKGLRPTIPKNTLPKLSELLEKCWQQDPSLRPDFSEIINVLQQVTKEVKDDEGKEKSSGGFLSLLRRGHH